MREVRKMQIKGILFDKDGTLLDFNSMWLTVAVEVAKRLAEECHSTEIDADTFEVAEKILAAMGVEHGIVKEDGPLAYMTYEQIGEQVTKMLRAEQIIPPAVLADGKLSVLFEKILEQETLCIVPTCNLSNLFERLKKKGIKVGLATADNVRVTKRCIEKLGIEAYLDFVGSDDGILKPKPERDMFDAFCDKNHLTPEEVAVLGDTPNDMLFARNCGGHPVGVLSGLSGRSQLQELAELIVDTPEEILEYIE